MAAERGSMPSTSSGTGSPGSHPDSPPQYQMDQLSIAEHMNANKQVLNRKLMVRRSVPELVDAGIYPPSPYAFAGQRILLERAKTGDILKHKIERRPARDFLVQHHILDDSNVDPSLQSMQRKLKKAKLTDELNEKLQHRPGPLELVEQRILEVEDPIKTALEEGQLTFQKAEDAVETSSVVKQPYVVEESPKSGQSSPDPSEFDDSNSITGTGATFSVSQVPSPPDISPLLNKPATLSRTIGGQTISIPLCSQPSQPFRPPGQFVAVPGPQQPYPSSSRSQQQGVLSSRPNRRNSRHSRSKQQAKQRVIKFHEYKGPPMSKASNSNSVGTFVTTTGPMQKLDGLTPHEMRVHQQNLYLQCQIEVESKTKPLPLLHSLKTAPVTPLSQPQLSDMHEMQEPPTPNPDLSRSRPETPGLSMRSPPTPMSGNSHSALQLSRSLSHLEDLKVADLKLELKRRDLTVSGSKPQLIERLREHQLRELSASIPSVSSASSAPSSDFTYSAGTPSVQSFSDESIMAPPSVGSMASVTASNVPPHLGSPPQTPGSPMEDLLRSTVNPGMETDESTSQSSKTTADMHKTVRAQAKQIEVLKRQLMQFQQQQPMVQQPLVTLPAPATPQVRPSQLEQLPSVTQLPQVPSAILPQVQDLLQPGSQQQGQAFTQHMQQQTTPIDITDKQVYVATPDGKMTAYKVILHTGNGVLQQVIPKPATSDQTSPTTVTPNSQPTGDHTVSLPDLANLDRKGLSSSALHGTDEQSINVGDVIDVLIQTGEMDPEAVSGEEQKTGEQLGEERMDEHQTEQLAHEENLELELPLSPLDMDWIDTNSNSHYPEAFTSHHVPTAEGLVYNGHNEFDWLSNMHLDMEQPKMNSFDDINSSGRSLSTSDPVLSPKPPDLMNIFNLDDSDFRVATESGSDYNWDKLISQTSNNL